MDLPDFTAALLLALVACTSAQRVAPGVHPQHYVSSNKSVYFICCNIVQPAGRVVL